MLALHRVGIGSTSEGKACFFAKHRIVHCKSRTSQRDDVVQFYTETWWGSTQVIRCNYPFVKIGNKDDKKEERLCVGQTGKVTCKATHNVVCVKEPLVLQVPTRLVRDMKGCALEVFPAGLILYWQKSDDDPGGYKLPIGMEYPKGHKWAFYSDLWNLQQATGEHVMVVSLQCRRWI